MNKIVSFVCFIFLTLSTGVSAKPAPGWYQGSVESALKEAGEKGKPLFVYWGAVWCPPCNHIKKTVFTQHEFLEEAKNFISVYLDGDLPEAQKWGEHFGTVGYPTMMILNSKGEEIYRMPFGLKAPEYALLMKQVRTNLANISTLLTKTNKSELEWDILAKHSWEQDKVLKPDFLQLARECKGHSCQRLYLLALSDVLEKEDIQDKKVWQERLITFLKDPKVVKNNLEFFYFESEAAIGKLFEKNERAEVARLWTSALEGLLSDSTLTIDERISSLLGRIDIEKLMKGSLSAELIKLTQQKVEWADFNAKDHMERQTVLSTAIYLLMQIDKLDAAKKLALAELKKSQSPYYFMSYLGSIANKQGHQDESLQWYRKAWQASEGHATRFEWGTSYILKALKYGKFEDGQVQADYKTILDEVLAQKDAFAGRSRSRFKRLVRTLTEVSPKGMETLKKICAKDKAQASALSEVISEALKKS